MVRIVAQKAPSVGHANVLGVGMDTVLDAAQAEVTVACVALKTLQTMDFWKIPELDLLSLAQSIEGVARLGYAAQVRVAGEVDTRHTAASSGPRPPSPCSAKP